MEKDRVTLNSAMRCDALMIPSTVVDRMIGDANEAQLKIYLYLLKMGSNEDVTISSIADYFNYTEADVQRALRFWDCESSSCTATKREPDAQGDNVVAFSTRPLSYTKQQLAEFARIPEVSQLLFVTEQYMGRPLKSDDISSILYMYDEMDFSAELIEYLLEYCISNNKKNFRAIGIVADEWKALGVATLADAKKITMQIPKIMPEVMAAFGLDDKKTPVDAQIAYVRKWTEIFGFGIDIIKEAAKRTVMTINKPDFRYANGILKGWYDNNVRSISDVLACDETYRQKKATSDIVVDKPSTGVKAKKADKKSKFHNFEEREYDYDALLKDALSN